MLVTVFDDRTGAQPWDAPDALHRPMPPDDGRPLLAVVGNCQAESLRLLIGSDDVCSVRLPAVHELVASDVPALQRLVRRVDHLVVQPVADDYHGLPVGTSQLVDLLRAGARHAVAPLVRWSGLHPWHAVVHPPELADPVPPVVAYHDVRTAVAAAWDARGIVPPREAMGPGDEHGVRTVGELSLAELARREAAAGAVVVSDQLATASFESMRTINHPGNIVLEPLVARLRAALGLAARAPGVTRPLLASVQAPREPLVARVHAPGEPTTLHWTVDGEQVDDAAVATAQRRWYAGRPDVLDVLLERTAGTRALLGLRTPQECR